MNPESVESTCPCWRPGTPLGWCSTCVETLVAVLNLKAESDKKKAIDQVTQLEMESRDDEIQDMKDALVADIRIDYEQKYRELENDNELRIREELSDYEDKIFELNDLLERAREEIYKWKDENWELQDQIKNYDRCDKI